MASALRIGSIVLRVDDLRRQAEFWEAALGYVRHELDHDFILLRPRDGVGPTLSLDQVPSKVQIPGPRGQPLLRGGLHRDDGPFETLSFAAESGGLPQP